MLLKKSFKIIIFSWLIVMNFDALVASDDLEYSSCSSHEREQPQGCWIKEDSGLYRFESHSNGRLPVPGIAHDSKQSVFVQEWLQAVKVPDLAGQVFPELTVDSGSDSDHGNLSRTHSFYGRDEIAPVIGTDGSSRTQAHPLYGLNNWVVPVTVYDQSTRKAASSDKSGSCCSCGCCGALLKRLLSRGQQ